MARMPGTRWLGEQSPRNRMARYDIVCVHTIVGYAPAHAAHFSVHADGSIDQSRDTEYQSAANLYGNHRVIAIENEDHGPAFGGTPRLPGWVPLTDAQVQANGRILAWAHQTHGVPLQLCPNSRPTSRGLAYHRQGIDGNFGSYRFGGRISGGEVWTSSPGKVCPTDVRIAQLPDILRYATGGGGEVDEMPDPKELWQYEIPGTDDFNVKWKAQTYLRNQTIQTAKLRRQFNTFRKHELARDRALADTLEAIENDMASGSSREQVKRIRQALMDKLRAIQADIDAAETDEQADTAAAAQPESA